MLETGEGLDPQEPVLTVLLGYTDGDWGALVHFNRSDCSAAVLVQRRDAFAPVLPP